MRVSPNLRNTRGDVDGDGKADIAILGVSGNTIPVAISLGSGKFNYVNAVITGDTNFGVYATQGSPHVVMGDFNGDGRADVALVGGTSPNGVTWTTLPVAYGQPGNTFQAVNSDSGDNGRLTDYASLPGSQVVASDVNGDGYDDLVIVNRSGVAIGISSGGDFSMANPSTKAGSPNTIDMFSIFATQQGAKLVAGDFNNDGRGDFALTGGSWWNSIPVAFSAYPYFRVTNVAGNDNGTFAYYAALPGVSPVSGDFDGDGFTDLALAGGAGWSTVPVANGKGDGTFTFTNVELHNFQTWAGQRSATPEAVRGPWFIAGDFDGNGKVDLALSGAQGWSTIPVALSYGAGRFGEFSYPQNSVVSTIPGLASQGTATALSASSFPTTSDSCSAISNIHVQRLLGSELQVAFDVSSPVKVRVGALRFSFASYPEQAVDTYYDAPGTYWAQLDHLRDGVEYWAQIVPEALAQSNGIPSCGPALIDVPANACGEEGLTCCDTMVGSGCDPADICMAPGTAWGNLDPTCVHCGRFGEPCCAGDTCLNDMSGIPGKCTPQPPPPANTITVLGSLCEEAPRPPPAPKPTPTPPPPAPKPTCGVIGLPCCTAGVCNTGSCDASTRSCESSAGHGYIGQACNPNDETTCAFGASKCQLSLSGSYRCAPCGRPGETCCPIDYGNCPGPNGCVPQTNTCQPYDPSSP